VSAVQRKDTGAVYAMKEMGKRHVKFKHSERMVKAEKSVLRKMSSPFVLNLSYSFQDNTNLYFIFTMLGGGELNFHLNALPNKSFGPTRTRYYAAEILLGLDHIHSHNFVYRDLKLSNVLLDSNGHVVISDLGLAVQLKEDKMICEAAGTPGYWAPEVVSHQGTYKTSDWWTFAVVIFIMLTGRKPKCACDRKAGTEWCPFQQNKGNDKFARSEESKLKLSVDYTSDKLDGDAITLFKKLFVEDPTTRLGCNGAQEIRDHAFFKDTNWEMMEKREVPAEFRPTKGMVYCNSIAEVGEVDKSKFKKTKITEEDQKYYETFSYSSKSKTLAEIAEAMKKMDTLVPAPPPPPEENSCCTLL